MSKITEQLKKLSTHPYAGMVSSEWTQSNREILLMQLKNSMAPAVAPTYETLPSFLIEFKRLVRRYFATQNPWVLAGRMALAAVVVLVVPFTGWVTTVNAALLSVPGDALYGIKIVSEQVQISLAGDKQTELKLRTEFASRRADELVKLSTRPAEEAAPHIKQTAQRLTEEIKNVQTTLDQLVVKSNPETVADAARNVDIKTDEIAKVLGKNPSITLQVPEAQEAKTIADQTSVNAAETLIKTKQDDASSPVSNAELKQNIQEKIVSAQTQLLTVVSSLTSATSTVSLPEAAALKTSVNEQVKNAKDVVQQATTSVQSDHFEDAISKVKEAKTIVSETEKLIATATQAQAAATASATTSTPKLITPVTTTTTERAVTSTKEFIKSEGTLKTQIDRGTSTSIDTLLDTPPTEISSP